MIPNNFIGIFPNIASKEYCKRIIDRFEFVKETNSESRGKIITRQDHEGISKIKKEDSTYFLGEVFSRDILLFKEFSEIMWGCYDIYAKEYGILGEGARYKIAHTVRIQKTEPGQGYHLWHCDNSGRDVASRLVVVSLYLNTIEEGGETEFLYQNIRVSPVEGTLVFFPAGWTHPHRGNPPLKENKYILNTWLEYIE
jgi:hypothetical protein